MGRSLAQGGHLTHGVAFDSSGKWFKVVSSGFNAKADTDDEPVVYP